MGIRRNVARLVAVAALAATVVALVGATPSGESVTVTAGPSGESMTVTADASGDSAATTSDAIADATTGPETSVIPDHPNISVMASSAPSWLAEVNLYRVGAGLKPLAHQPAWETGLRHHLTYLAKTPASYFTGRYASVHTENPASPYYTKAGAQHSGTVVIEWAYDHSDVDVIDEWLAVPFHSLMFLDPAQTHAAFAYDRTSGYGAADIGGYDRARSRPGHPILFPGAGMTTDLRVYADAESPDPLESCHWSRRPAQVGLPLIAGLESAPSTSLSAQVIGPHGVFADSANGSLCVITQHTYRTSDGVYGPAGADALTSANAVVLMANKAYTPGVYTARIRQPGRATISWTFAVGSKPRLGCAGFPDVAKSNSFCHHIAWFAKQNITHGMPDGTFGATRPVTRGAMAAFLYRMTHGGAAAPKCTSRPFPDVKVSDQFCGQIAWFAKQNITYGFPDGKYHASSPVTRRAMAAFLHRMQG